MNAQLTEIMRLITNLIRTGTVTEVDRDNWLCRVKTGNLETNWINWLTMRAGNSRTWWKPSVGEQVVLFSLGGNLETAFALPAVYSNQFPPPSDSEEGNVTEYPDGGWFEYEPETGRWYVRGIKSMVIEAADILIWQNWDTLGPKFNAMWDVVCAATDAACAWIKQAVSTAWEGIRFLFFNFTLPGLIAKNWEAIKAGVSEAWTTVRQVISDKWAAILADVAALPAKFQDMGSAIIDSILSGINAKWETLKSKLSSVTDYLPDWMTGNNKAPGKTQVQVVGGAASAAVPFAGMYDSGGVIPRGQFGVVGENGPEIVNGPAHVTSRRRTAALASVVAGMMGTAAMPAEAAPLHPLSLPTSTYRAPAEKAASQPSVVRYEINAPIHITAQPGQSAQDIAREVARQLDERERRARAKARSNYSDQGGYDS